MPARLMKVRWRPRLREPLDRRPPAGSSSAPKGRREAGGPTIGIATDDSAAHVAEICAGLAALGARGVPFRLMDCAFDSAAPHGLRIPGFADALPDAVFVRALAGGSFEAVTKRLGILHALGALGVPVINSAKAMENCVDKSMTSFLLARASIVTPSAWVVETREAAALIAARELTFGPLVLKPLFGSQGRGLRLIESVDQLPAPEDVNGVFYLQRFVSTEGPDFWDFRLLVSRGRVLSAMCRRSDSWIVNIKQGGRPTRFLPNDEFTALAIAAAAAVGASFSGVDIIAGFDGLHVIEVNSTPAWAGLQSVTDFDISAVVAGDILAISQAR
jgi:tetrahydromethanopterin:alpha-L-glutamate ligase